MNYGQDSDARHELSVFRRTFTLVYQGMMLRSSLYIKSIFQIIINKIHFDRPGAKY